MPPPSQPQKDAFVKPRLRGVLHHSAAWYALGAGSVLVAMASTPRAAFASAVYSLSLVALFAVSAIYHRVHWKEERSRALMRQADHASIFVLIAGTYTPVALLGLGGDDGHRLLVMIWASAVGGVILSLVWPKAPKALTASIAVAMGWMIVPYFGQIKRFLGGELWLILAGGIAYTVGAIVYAAKKPDPLPRVFGYHEVFHALTLLGAILHFAAVVQIVRSSAM